MSQYTELLNEKAETLSPDDDDYEKNLREIATLFRGFGEALTAFIEKHGYIGDLTDVSAKAQFLREKFKTANVKQPRDFKKWFVPYPDIIERETAYRICFAFGLSVDETNDFFRCVKFERGFDCHDRSEAVYYFCMKNGLSYSEAQEIIDRIPEPKKIKAIPNREVLYTGTIIEYIDSIDDKEKLIQYITDNIDDFRYNNATAIKYIQELWADISKTDGLAEKESSIIAKTYTYNRYEDKHKKGVTDTRSAEVIAKEVRQQEQEVKPEDYVIVDSNSSTWTIFSHIIGLPNYMVSKYANKYDRSLTSVLSKNVLMPLNASDCFPSQRSIDKLLRGELVDNELMRKMLIFLVFYTHWAEIITKKNYALYSARYPDPERCMDRINKRLLDAGYPELYAGNPYDWLFMWSLNDEHPLDAFRSYMREVFDEKEKQENTVE